MNHPVAAVAISLIIKRHNTRTGRKRPEERARLEFASQRNTRVYLQHARTVCTFEAAFAFFERDRRLGVYGYDSC